MTAPAPQSLSSSLALVGDLGGTHARFALADCAVDPPRLTQVVTLRCKDWATAEQAVSSYLAALGAEQNPVVATLAAAGPVVGEAVKLTNNHWHCSVAGLRRMGFASAMLLNDFEALAHAAAQLRSCDLTSLGPERPVAAQGSVVVLGPGTGFGVAVLARSALASVVLATEAGNVAFAPTDALEDQILRILREQLGLVSVEALLSGPGLLNLYRALCQIEQMPEQANAATQITQLARADDRLARLAVARFCAILGAVAGDAALAYGARGGVYITGGVADALAVELPLSQFRQRFEDKGRYRPYVSAIPTALITRPHTALLGAATVARSLLRGSAVS